VIEAVSDKATKLKKEAELQSDSTVISLGSTVAFEYFDYISFKACFNI
jgi:hypothetical protein